MKILDWYILKKYLNTFITIQLLFIPIAIVVNLADNIDKILANEVPFNLVAEYSDLTSEGHDGERNESGKLSLGAILFF